MIYSYGVTQQGAYHVKNNTVCQDAHKYTRIDDDFAVGAVADGLGSELYTDVASQLAVETAVSHCAASITKDSSEESVLGVMEDAFQLALDKINETAAENDHSPDQYDTTLALAVYIKGRVYYGNSGDSGIIVQNTDGTYESVTSQQRDEYGCVFPLAFGKEKWVFGIKDNVSSVLLATDGMYETFFPYLLKGEKISIYVALAYYMMNENSLGFSTSSEAAVQEKMDAFIGNIPGNDVSDDKTVLVMLDTDIQADLQPDEYYATPDWQSLKKKREEEYRRAAYPHLYKDET